ncbi:MAG: transglutaminase-like putative cysteine protease [Rubritalea sp.]|jgi:transglutaminase-like putative cysteine protease
MNHYLESTEYIDWNTADILAKAKALDNGSTYSIEITRQCFTFVRDEIKHSNDYKLNLVTYKASDALEHRKGYCYAKSHLLAASSVPIKYQLACVISV